MADITFLQKPKIERVFELQSGYVLDWSNNSFRDFMAESAGVDIYSDRYEKDSGSKANRLRRFMELESNHLVGKVLIDILDYRNSLPNYQNPWKDKVSDDDIQFVLDLANSLIADGGFVKVAPLEAYDFQHSFRILRKSVEEAIKNDDPVSGIDRLHTFLIEYTRLKLNKHKIVYLETESLNAVFGKLVNCYQKGGLIQTPMAIRILRTSISNIDAFNKVRNDHSLAHGNNDIINKSEAKLIFNSINSLVNYIESFDPEQDDPENKNDSEEIDDFPF